MGRAPCCDKANVKKGPWSPEEDAKLKEYIQNYGIGGNWIALPQKAGLRRCGKSCRLRWLNYLRPNIKHGDFSDFEDRLICTLFASIGSRWSIIAAQLPGRTDNDIKNYWNTKLKKKLLGMAAASQKTPQPPSNHPSTFPILEPSSLTSPSDYFNSPQFSFTCYDQSESFSISSCLVSKAPASSSLSSPSGLQTHHGYMHSMNRLQESFVRLGGEVSSSSSHGSSINQLSYDKEGVRDLCGNTLEVELQGYLSYGVVGNQKAEKNNGFFEENPLEYTFEEIKHIICTNFCNNILVDENTTTGQVVYY